MNKSLNQEHIQEIALETGIDPAFIEKDWYAVQLLALLAKYENDTDIQMIFSGGTSLSKGYGIIQRFSEDLDFILNVPEGGQALSQGKRRNFRREVIAHVTSDARFSIDEDKVQRGDSHRFFKAPLTYARQFQHASLRPDLQLEMSFCKSRLPAEICSIQSIASNVMGENPETEILCISPLETAGDKLSALTWRVLVRDRNAKNDDPTMIRHLHDLAALEDVVSRNQEVFAKSALQSLEQDRSRRGGETIQSLPINERLEQALKILKEDTQYRKEYEQFVMNMSYADDEHKIDFDGAYMALERIVDIQLNAQKGWK